MSIRDKIGNNARVIKSRDIEGFYNFEKPGDAIRGVFSHSFTSKAGDEILVLYNTECEPTHYLDIGTNKETEYSDCLAITMSYKDLERKHNSYIGNFGSIKEGSIVTICYDEDKDIGRQHPLKVFTFAVEPGSLVDRVKTGDQIPF